MTLESLAECNFQFTKKYIFDPCLFTYDKFQEEREGSEYGACGFILNGSKVKFRSSKITPKKIGQFVTLWQRNIEGITEPHHLTCKSELFIIHVRKNNLSGQFIFPKNVLYEQGIISGEQSLGKRGFRVYPAWDKPSSKHAEKTQKWQLNYFLTISSDGSIDLERAKDLYQYNH